MKIISLTPNSPYCVEFEQEEFVQFAWISNLSDCKFTGVLEDGILVSRMAWQMDPPWGKEERGVIGIASLETLYQYRCRGYGKALVDYIRAQYPGLPLVLEINNPFAFKFWSRYKPQVLGKGRAHNYVYKIAPLLAKNEQS